MVGEPNNDLIVDATFIETSGSLYQMRVYQAAGMVAVQADCPVTAAVALLVDHATDHGLSIAETAQHVVERRLRFG